MSTVAIDNVGPITHLDLPIPEGGGIVVLKGRNGRGKSHALSAVSSLGEPTKLPVRDGELKATVEGFGITVSVGRKTSRRGTLTCKILQGEDPTLFVDPGLKDGGAADRKRLEAILRLARAETNIDIFHDHIRGISEVPTPETIRATDLPDMAARLKRDLEAAARLQEGHAENARGRATALASAATVSTDPVDMKALRDALEAVNVETGREEERIEAARKAADLAAEARTALAEAEKEYDGPSVEEAKKAQVIAFEEVKELEAKLSSAKQAFDLASSLHSSAQRHEVTVARWRKAIEDGASVTVDASRLEQLRGDQEARSQALEEAAVLVERQKDRAAYEEAEARVKASEAEAERLRGCAASVEGVLCEVFGDIAPEGLSLSGGRLFMQTKRGKTLVSELSPGERWSIAIGISVRVGCDLMAIPQEAWEALDPENRKAAQAAAKEHGVVIVTAEASDGELRAEVEE